MTISYKRGFTLIELLVVIAIIGILSSIVLASLNSARKKGRDARRVSDIKQLQLALELYYDSNGSYPDGVYAGLSDLTAGGFIASLPSDPNGGTTSYGYVGLPATTACTSTGGCTSYVVGAILEGVAHTALAGDSDAAQAITLNGAANDCDGGGGTGAGSPGSAEVVYCVKP